MAWKQCDHRFGLPIAGLLGTANDRRGAAVAYSDDNPGYWLPVLELFGFDRLEVWIRRFEERRRKRGAIIPDLQVSSLPPPVTSVQVNDLHTLPVFSSKEVRNVRKLLARNEPASITCLATGWAGSVRENQPVVP